MFKSGKIIELLESVLKELRQIKSALKLNILKESCKKNKKEEEKDNG